MKKFLIFIAAILLVCILASATCPSRSDCVDSIYGELLEVRDAKYQYELDNAQSLADAKIQYDKYFVFSTAKMYDDLVAIGLFGQVIHLVYWSYDSSDNIYEYRYNRLGEIADVICGMFD